MSRVMSRSWVRAGGATSSNTGTFVPLTPQRIYDSRFETMVNVELTFRRGTGIIQDVAYVAGMDDVPGAIFVNGTYTGTPRPDSSRSARSAPRTRPRTSTPVPPPARSPTPPSSRCPERAPAST